MPETYQQVEAKVAALRARVRELEGLRQAETDLRRLQEQRAERAELELATGVNALTESLLQVTNERDALRAEKENAERRLREYEHHVMTGRNEQHDKLVAENERLRGVLQDAADTMRGVRDYDGIVAEIDATLAGGKQ